MNTWLSLLFCMGILACHAQEAPPLQMANIPDEENAILAQVLDIHSTGEGVIAVSPHTCWPYNSYINDLTDTNRTAKIKEHILCEMHCDSSDVDGLIDQLLEKNAVFYQHTLPSPEDRRYVIDYDGKLTEPDEDDRKSRQVADLYSVPNYVTSIARSNEDDHEPGQIWEPEPVPKYNLLICVARPAIDPVSGRVLAYVVRGNNVGTLGDIILYENENGKLKQTRRGTIVR